MRRRTGHRVCGIKIQLIVVIPIKTVIVTVIIPTLRIAFWVHDTAIIVRNPEDSIGPNSIRVKMDEFVSYVIVVVVVVVAVVVVVVVVIIIVLEVVTVRTQLLEEHRAGSGFVVSVLSYLKPD